MRNNDQNRIERLAMLEAWRQSGLSKRAYSQQQHISYHTLQYWCKKTKRASGTSRPLPGGKAFLPLKIKPSSCPSSHTFCELITAGGKRLIFHPGVEACFLKTLLD